MQPSAKILLVDDRKENLHALGSVLQSDVEVFKAASGREALELLLQHRFAVALLDVQMPEINGFELAELMRGSDHTKEIPIIFVTAGAIDPHHTFRGYEAGAVDFLYKPLDARIVRSKVQVFLRMEQQRLQIQEQLEQLQAALRVRDEFLSIASHELKTPLTSLGLQVQLARRTIKIADGVAPSPEKLAQTLDLANRQIAKLTHLIDDLLDGSRIQGGQLTVSKSATDLVALVREVTERLQPHLEQAGCAVQLHLADSLTAPCESFRVEQVLINLISNVTKYAPGSPVTISLYLKEGRAVLEVRDEGPGIPEDKLESIFDRFERGGKKTGVSGLGLGLYISREIMLAHGGSLRATSRLGAGATFIAELPVV